MCRLWFSSVRSEQCRQDTLQWCGVSESSAGRNATSNRTVDHPAATLFPTSRLFYTTLNFNVLQCPGAPDYLRCQMYHCKYFMILWLSAHIILKGLPSVSHLFLNFVSHLIVNIFWVYCAGFLSQRILNVLGKNCN